MPQRGIRGDEERVSNDAAGESVFTLMIADLADQSGCYLRDKIQAWVLMLHKWPKQSVSKAPGNSFIAAPTR